MGDALGAPHEFRQNACNVYAGKLELQAFRFNRFTKETKYFPTGSASDDSEMLLALLRTIEDGEYCPDRALRAYLDWANSGCPHLGKNTRALFHGVKTVRGYTNRMNKMLQNEVSQSNGSLMRCSPLALVKDWKKAAILDCDLSSPNPINTDCSLVYLSWLTSILKGEGPPTDYSNYEEEIQEVLTEEDRDIDGKTKGWVLHALWCAQLALKEDSFTSLMRAERHEVDDNREEGRYRYERSYCGCCPWRETWLQEVDERTRKLGLGQRSSGVRPQGVRGNVFRI